MEYSHLIRISPKFGPLRRAAICTRTESREHLLATAATAKLLTQNQIINSSQVPNRNENPRNDEKKCTKESS